MILADKVRFVYAKPNKKALDDFSLTVDRGEIFALVGPNGAGKTTFLRVLAGLIIPASGSVRIGGFDVLSQTREARRILGFSSGEERSFYYRLTGGQNLEFFGALYGVPRRELKARISEVLDLLEITHLAQVPYRKYSLGGMKKLSLARALLSDPEVCLFDEPNNGIDPASAVKIRALIQSLSLRGKTILVTTHNLDEAERLAHRVGIMKQGKLIACDSLAALKESYRPLGCELLIADACAASGHTDFIRRIKAFPGADITQVNQNKVRIEFRNGECINDILKIALECQVAIRAIHEESAGLEDIFMAVTGAQS